MRLHDFFDYYSRENPDSGFSIFGASKLTYQEASAQINKLSNAFSDAGLQKGDRFAVLSKNSVEYVLIYYAASKAGVVPVPMNYRLSPAEWVYIVNDSQSKLLMASGEYLDAVDGIKGELDSVSKYVSIGTTNTTGWDNYGAWVDGQPTTACDTFISPDDDLFQMYTSGTTGHPKGVVLTHRSVVANVIQCIPQVTSGLEQRFLIVAPLYHAAASFCSFCCVSQGGCLYISEEFNPGEVVRVLDEEQINHALLVPAMIQACLVAASNGDERGYTNLEYIAYGASAIAEETLSRAMDTFKCDFIQAFGMTELSPVATLMSPDDHRRALASKPELLLSAGRAVIGSEIRVVDEDDNPLPIGTMGEIVVRGPQVMKGYWNLPDETAEAIRDGWMHTGDAGTLDDEGFLYIQDRIKDMIVSGGENIYPRVIEEVLFKHPAIADAAVIGVPHDRWGETVKAIVQLREGASATEDELMEFCRGRLGGFECPSSVDFIDSLPRNASGKVLKRELREPYWVGQSRRVAGS